MSGAFACPACGVQVDPEVATAVPYPSTPGPDSVPRPASVLYCPACGLGIAWPRVADDLLDEYYRQGEYWGEIGEPELLVPKLHPGHFALAQARWAFARSALKVVPRPEEFSILDVGSGHGFFGVVASRDPGITLTRYVAVESDGHLRESLERSWDTFAKRGDLVSLSDFSQVEGAFDLVVLSNILEHLNDPAGLLGAVVSRLAPGGVVFADVPCKDERYKPDVFPHVLFFDVAALSALFERAGFEIVRASVFGRPPATSPIAAANADRLDVKLTSQLYGLRRVLPEGVSVRWFARHFGAWTSGEDGTWVRLAARAKKPE